MCMSAAHDERKYGEFNRVAGLSRLQEHRVYVAFQMVHRNQGQAGGETERLRIRDSDQERSHKSRAFRNGDRGEFLERRIRAQERFPHHRNNGAKVLSRCQLRYHAAVFAVRVQLRGDDGGQHARAVFNYRGGRFIARRFYRQDSHPLLF